MRRLIPCRHGADSFLSPDLTGEAVKKRNERGCVRVGEGLIHPVQYDGGRASYTTRRDGGRDESAHIFHLLLRRTGGGEGYRGGAEGAPSSVCVHSQLASRSLAATQGSGGGPELEPRTRREDREGIIWASLPRLRNGPPRVLRSSPPSTNPALPSAFIHQTPSSSPAAMIRLHLPRPSA